MCRATNEADQFGCPETSTADCLYMVETDMSAFIEVQPVFPGVERMLFVYDFSRYPHPKIPPIDFPS